MRLLVLGGTVFLGRHVTAEALRRGHEVTLFHRGVHGAQLFQEAEHVLGDRAGDLAALRGRSWDIAVDTSGYEPADVARSSALDIGHLVFVSTCNVYPAWPSEPVDENSTVWTEGDDYGPKKAACEREADAALNGRVAHVRAGLLCGPHDNIFRVPWWVRRIAAGGDVVAPGDPGRTVQLIDARDLASWMLDLAERGVAGTFNGTAPPRQTTMGDALAAAVEATGAGARLHWIADEVLEAHGVEPWDELPLWIPEATGAGTWAVGTERAQAAGLRCRPVAETVADTWAWLRDGGEAELSEWRADHRPRGLTPESERELLATLR
ncbi:MAG TPA: NAD-dependent epimerase/dehydratase family protein [Solirubrobacteraceae bacterium]|nr:NAD-dependent epimerase/dehydratase family protein [Solirubrobacteraceae bacterium]